MVQGCQLYVNIVVKIGEMIFGTATCYIKTLLYICLIRQQQPKVWAQQQTLWIVTVDIWGHLGLKT